MAKTAPVAKPSAAVVNAAFGVSPEVEAQLRADAQAEANATVDLAALKARFLAEAIAAKEAEVQAEVSVTADEEIAAKGIGDFDLQGFPAKYVKLNVYEGHEKTDLPYVTLGVNGYQLQVLRGTDVIMPDCFRQVLDHARTAVPIQTEGGLICRERHRFPFSVLGSATAKEYQAFRETNKAALRMAEAVRIKQ